MGRRHVIAQLRKATMAPGENNAVRCKDKGVILTESDRRSLVLRSQLDDGQEGGLGMLTSAAPMAEAMMRIR